MLFYCGVNFPLFSGDFGSWYKNRGFGNEIHLLPGGNSGFSHLQQNRLIGMKFEGEWNQFPTVIDFNGDDLCFVVEGLSVTQRKRETLCKWVGKKEAETVLCFPAPEVCFVSAGD